MDRREPPPGLPAGRTVVLDDRAVLWRGASVVLGGAPWGVLRIAAAGRPFLRRLAAAGAAGVVPSPGLEQALANLLSARGIVHPVSPSAAPGICGLDVIVGLRAAGAARGLPGVGARDGAGGQADRGRRRVGR
jgi:hypothetical protein